MESNNKCQFKEKCISYPSRCESCTEQHGADYYNPINPTPKRYGLVFGKWKKEANKGEVVLE